MNPQAPSLLLAGLLMVVTAVPAASSNAPGGWGAFRVLSGAAAADKGELTVKGKSAVVAVGETKASAYRLTVEIQLAAKAGRGAAAVVVLPTDIQDVTKGGAIRVGINRDAAGRVLRVSTANSKKPGVGGDVPQDFTFWPADNAKSKKKSDGLEEAGVNPRTWHDRWLHLRIDVHERTLTVWLEGLLVKQIEPQRARGGRC